MPIEIRPFEAEHIDEVKSFNQRLAARGGTFRFAESPVPGWLPRRDSLPLYQELFVALEGKTVRGAYCLKFQPFDVNHETRQVACLQLPLSEGTVDPRYATLGVQLVRDALNRQPLLFTLGMGGVGRSFPQLLTRLRWSLVECPFYFRVVHPFSFLRGITVLRHRRSRRLALDALAFSGLGWIGLKGLHAWRSRRVGPEDLADEVVSEFAGWADHIWDRARGAYSLIAVRDATVLHTLYPAPAARFIRIKLTRRGEPVGWAVLLATRMSRHKQFGDLRVGSVVDCLAVPGSEAGVVAAATRHLQHSGVDLIVSNQLNRAWGDAFLRAGYLRGPSNFAFALSPALGKTLQPFDQKANRVHMTRGDGDGPIHL